VKIKNIPKNLSIYSNRALLWNTNSEPYLSGDLFADKSDVNIYPYLFRGFQPSKKKVAEASVIFCRSDLLERFLDEYIGSINAKVLILGNSDRDFNDFEFSLPPGIKQVFVQNLMFRDSRLSLLPIGLENRRFAVNGNLSRFDYAGNVPQKLNQVLMGPLSETHVERRPLQQLFKDLQGVTYMEERLSPAEYINIAKNYSFVAAPRGNGMDTHRFWETLYLNSLPIVLKSAWANQVVELGIPVITIPEWSQSEIATAINSSKPLGANPRSSAAIWWEFWRQKIQSYC
jgi:hypothetical protein